jgi:hypothetical protein
MHGVEILYLVKIFYAPAIATGAPSGSIEGAQTKKNRLSGRYGDAMQSDELLFEMHGPDGRVWRVYMDGRTEGFPTGTVVENRALPLLNALQGGFFAAMVPDLPTAAALLAEYTTTEKSLQPSDPLRVGDGTDGLPVWIGVDAEAGRTYRAYANGIVTGFGDGTITSRVGVGPNPGRATEVRTSGNHLVVQYGEGMNQKIEFIKLSNPD